MRTNLLLNTPTILIIILIRVLDLSLNSPEPQAAAGFFQISEKISEKIFDAEKRGTLIQ